MKKLFFVFLLLFPVFCFAQSTTSGDVYKPLKPAVYNETNWSDLSDFTSTATASVSGGVINMTGGATDFTQYISLKDTTCTNHWKITVRAKLTSAVNGTSYGWSVGLRSIGTVSKNSLAVFPSTSNTANGQMEFFRQKDGSAFSTEWWIGVGSSVPIAQNDEVVVSLERNNQTLELTEYNQTTNSVMADTVITISLNSGDVVMPNISVPTIWMHGGAVTIDSIYYQTYEAVNSDVMFVGDSKTYGYGATNFTAIYPAILGNTFPSYTICAGFGDATQDIIYRLSEIVALKPKVVICAFGSNDVRTSVPDATWHSNMIYIDTTLTNAGIKVLWCLPFKEASLDLSAQAAWMANQFTDRVIDTWTATQSGGLLYSDGIHLNDKGNRQVAGAIKASPLVNDINVQNANQ